MAHSHARRHYRAARREIEHSAQDNTFVLENENALYLTVMGALALIVLLKGIFIGWFIWGRR